MTDLYSGAIPVLMVYVSAKLGLSISEAAFVASFYTIFSSLSQPLFGYFGDRYGGRLFVSGGVFLISVFQGLMAFAPSYGTLLLCAAIAGLGSAAFHPQGASGATKNAGNKKTMSMAIFMLGGNSGFAFGPLVSGFVLANFGFAGMPFVSLLGIVIAPLLYFVIDRNQPAKTQSKGSIARNMAFTGFGILALMLVMTARAWVQSAITFFTPTYVKSLPGFDVTVGSQMSFINLIALALGSLMGGYAADRFGGRKVLLTSFIATTPLIYAYWSVQDWRMFLIAPVLGFLTGMAWPPLIVLAQELFPKGAGLASGLTLGFAFATGGIGQTITGFLAEPERLGLFTALIMTSALPLVAALFSLALPTREQVQAGAKAMINSAPNVVQKTHS